MMLYLRDQSCAALLVIPDHVTLACNPYFTKYGE